MFRFYDIPAKGDIVAAIEDGKQRFKAKTGQEPSVLLVHPKRLTEVQALYSLARLRQPDEPLPQPTQVVIGG